MRTRIILFLFGAAIIIALTAFAHAAEPAPALEQPKFFSTEHRIEFAMLTAEMAYDGYSTQRILNSGGHEQNPLARPFVKRGNAGQAVASIGGAGMVLGIAYLLHRTHHDRAATWTLRITTVVEGIGCITNAQEVAKIRTKPVTP